MRPFTSSFLRRRIDLDENTYATISGATQRVEGRTKGRIIIHTFTTVVWHKTDDKPESRPRSELDDCQG